MTSAAAPARNGAPLAGIRVLALEGFIAAPYASMWLADMGAEVIKIEEPSAGDPARSVSPLRGDESQTSLTFIRINRNKKSVTLNLKAPEGRKIFAQLVAKSDIVIENLRPDALEKLGFTYAWMKEINPQIIYTSLSGFGHNDILAGPYTDMPAFDVIGQAMAGLMMRPDRPSPDPLWLGFPLADLFTGTIGVCGTLLALLQRAQKTEGSRVDIAMYDSCLALNELAVSWQSATGTTLGPGLPAFSYPFGSFKGPDGYIILAVVGDRIWQRFCQAIDRPDLLQDPSLATGPGRHEQQLRLTKIIEDWLSTRGRDEAVRHLVQNGVPSSAVQDTDDIISCPQVEARKMLVPVQDPNWGRVEVVAQPVKTSFFTESPSGPPPALGEHTDALLSDLASVSADELVRLRERGII